MAILTMLIGGIIAAIGSIMKNSWIFLIGSIWFAYYFFQIPGLPPSMKAITIFILFLWLINMGKGK